MKKIKLFLLLFLNFLSLSVQGNEKPRLMLLEVYRGQNLSGWVMSEKLDGVRAYWDGKQLIIRQGNTIHAPDYFLHAFPPFPIDGELYSPYLNHEAISGIVRAAQDKGWQQLNLWVFDVPDAKGNLFQRLQVLEEFLKKQPSQYIRIIEQLPIKNQQQAEKFFQMVVEKGGEGIVVRDPSVPYLRFRNSSILKWKPYQDSECRVRAHITGQGKLAGKTGSVLCEHPEFGLFRIGSGFSDAQRDHPPPINSMITFRYQEITQKGKPRFPRFLRSYDEF